MRVLHVIPAVARQYGGPSVVVLAVARALSESGHDVLVASTDADGDARLDVPVGRPTTWSGVPFVFFPRTASEAFKWSPGLACWLRRHVRGYDVVDVHAVFSHSSIAAGRACRAADVPYVVRPHGALDPWSLGRKPLQKAILMRVGVKRLLSGAARMQYTTAAEQRLAEQAIPWLPEGAVVPLGIDESLLTMRDEAASPEVPYVLVMSRLEAKKGLELLIDAFHRVAPVTAPWGWRLVLAGDGRADYVASLRRRSAAGPASGRIEFAGWIDGERKRSLLAGASLFASPSEQENFGLSLAEALAAGVPAFVSPGVNLAEAIESAGAGWVVPRDIQHMTAALAAVLADTEARARRGLAAQALAASFTWRRSAELAAALYEQAIDAMGARA